MNYYRLLTCDVLRECMKSMKINDMDKAQKSLKELMVLIESNQDIKNEKYIKGLLEDISGQAFEAISKKEFYDKWGKHYLPSLIFAHQQQYNNNFKDPGVQFYGGPTFNELRDKANDIFIKLPPPKPSKPKYNAYGANKGGHYKPAKPVDMSAYYNCHGGCFHGECNVLMDDDTLKTVQTLRPNDRIKGGAIIQCVVKHKCKENKMKLSNYNGLLITDYHPIRVQNEWVFPIDVDQGGNHKIFECEYVYNFVLSHNHIMIVNGVECCTLAHGFSTNEVIKHEYFGTNKIIEDLQKLSGWKNGVVTLNQNAFKRNEHNLVYKIAQ